ncbi:unnamed protein product [Ranitomeya imitator]|uniref:Uncharacterized protein n=2 Tax=Ranitomeya imitator TaxID=111125 RepID=A0ABN9M3M2_9NEOB|nr:unnamed protein product [Ranitomeya imitator]
MHPMILFALAAAAWHWLLQDIVPVYQIKGISKLFKLCLPKVQCFCDSLTSPPSERQFNALLMSVASLLANEIQGIGKLGVAVPRLQLPALTGERRPAVKHSTAVTAPLCFTAGAQSVREAEDEGPDQTPGIMVTRVNIGLLSAALRLVTRYLPWLPVKTSLNRRHTRRFSDVSGCFAMSYFGYPNNNQPNHGNYPVNHPQPNYNPGHYKPPPPHPGHYKPPPPHHGHYQPPPPHHGPNWNNVHHPPNYNGPPRPNWSNGHHGY